MAFLWTITARLRHSVYTYFMTISECVPGSLNLSTPPPPPHPLLSSPLPLPKAEMKGRLDLLVPCVSDLRTGRWGATAGGSGRLHPELWGASSLRKVSGRTVEQYIHLSSIHVSIIQSLQHFLYSSIYPSVHWSIVHILYPSFLKCVHPFIIFLSIHPSIHFHTHQSIASFIAFFYLFIHPYFHQSIHQFFHPSFFCFYYFTHACIDPSIHLFFSII